MASSTVGYSNALMSTTSGPVSFDHPLGGSWAPGVLIAPNEYQLPLSNRAGDQLVLGTKGTFNPRGTTPITLTATFRHGAAAWRTTETVATGNNATYEASTMGPDGTAAVVWYTFTRVCRRYCNSTNYVRHISSRAPGAAPWVDAGELPPPLNAGPATNNRLMALAADAMGHEVFLVSTTGGYVELISRSNGAWGAPVTPVADPINP